MLKDNLKTFLSFLMVVNIVNGNKSILIAQKNESRRPVWSRSGSMIAWTVLVGVKGEVWVMNSDGSDQRKLVDGLYPSWSPDSRTIIFSDFDASGSKIVLWRVGLDGSGLRQLTD
ncbi:MAG: TolB family protein [Bacteroidota bacterium]